MIYQFEVTRHDGMDPLSVIEQATRQAQTEACVSSVRQLPFPEERAPTFYYEQDDGFTDLKVWANNERALSHVLECMHDRFGIDTATYEIESIPEPPRRAHG